MAATRSGGDPFGRLAYGLFLVGCVTLPLLTVRVGGDISVSDGIFVASAVANLLSLSRPKISPLPVLHVAAVLLVIGAVASSSNDPQPSSGLLVAVRLLFLWLIWQWQARSLVSTWARLDAVCVAFCVGVAISASAALLQLRGYAVGEAYGLGRYAGFASHPNSAGALYAISIPFCVALAVRRNRYALVGAAAVVLDIVGLVLSASVSGMIAAGVGLLVFVIIHNLSRRGAIMLVVAPLASWFLLANAHQFLPGSIDPLRRVVATTGGGSGGSEAGTLQTRIQTWRFAWQHIRSHPWVGTGLSPTAGANFDGRVLTHNMFLLAWFQGGLLVLIAVAMALRCMTKGLLKGVRRETSSIRAPIVAAVASAFAYAMTGPVLFDRYFWFPLILALIVRQLRRQESPEDPPRTGWPSAEATQATTAPQ